MRFLILSLLVFTSIISAYAQNNYRVNPEVKEKILQAEFYNNPIYNEEDDSKIVNLGPALGNTYISEPDVTTLEDLNKFYPLSNVLLSQEWPSKYDVKNGNYVWITFDNGVNMPAIQSSDGTLFSFLIEEGYLAFDIKQKYIREEETSERIKWLTAELFRE